MTSIEKHRLQDPSSRFLEGRVLHEAKEIYMIDLVSDTTTLPSKAMLSTILNAQLGDAGRLDADGRGEDTTTNRLEDLAAAITGKESALFCPTGTMANSCAILACCPPGSTILVEERQHILEVEKICFQKDGFRMIPALYQIDQTGAPVLAGIQDQLSRQPIQMACVENTHNFSGGTCMATGDMARFKALCAQRGIHVHLDGARLFNAAEALGVTPREITENCDSLMFCISKGLGAPIGSLLCGSKAFISRAREWRKLLGGTMRQTGVAAACGIYALENHVQRLSEDRENAQYLAERLSALKVIQADPAPQSNILLLNLSRCGITGEHFSALLADRGIRCYLLSETEIRLVFHLGITKADTAYVAEQILAIDQTLLRTI